MNNKNTYIHILPSRENGKEAYLILFLDDAGEITENSQLTGFCPKTHSGKTISNIIIELVDGKPTTVRTIEE